jgi:hypothetical protein
MFWKFFWEFLWIFCGIFWEFYEEICRNVLEFFWNFFGILLEFFWTSFMEATFCDISAIGAGKYPRDQFRGTFKEERRTIYFLNAFGDT